MAPDRRWHPEDLDPVFVISVAAELAGLHAQTLRQYDRLGLVTPQRTTGGGRRYSGRDVAVLREVQRLSQEGISLAGIARILELELQVAALRARVAELTDEAAARSGDLGLRQTRVFSVTSTGDVYAARLGERPRVVRSTALVPWRPRP